MNTKSPHRYGELINVKSRVLMSKIYNNISKLNKTFNFCKLVSLKSSACKANFAGKIIFYVCIKAINTVDIFAKELQCLKIA